MAINVTAANNQAGQLNTYAQQLRNAKTLLTSYKSSIQSNWSGQEVSYIMQSIDQTISKINNVLKDLESLSTDIKNVASAIKREEDAAAVAACARAEKQRQINAAQTAYNNAVDEYDSVAKKMEELQKQLKKNPLLQFHPDFAKRFNTMKKNLEKAAQKCDSCRRTLTSVRGW